MAQEKQSYDMNNPEEQERLNLDLTAKLAALEAKMEANCSHSEAINKKLNDLHASVNKGTNWPAFIALGVALMTLVGALWGLGIEPLKKDILRVEINNKMAIKELYSHTRDNHPERVVELINQTNKANSIRQDFLDREFEQIRRKLESMDKVLSSLWDKRT